MTKLVLSSQTICSNDNTFILSFVEKKPSLIVKISSVCSDDPVDSGCDTSTPLSPLPGIKIEEPAIQKKFVQVEESVDDALLEELFRDSEQAIHASPSKALVSTRNTVSLSTDTCLTVRELTRTTGLVLDTFLLQRF